MNVSSVPGSPIAPLSVEKPFSSVDVADTLLSVGSTLSILSVVESVSRRLPSETSTVTVPSWGPSSTPRATRSAQVSVGLTPVTFSS